MCVIEGYCVKKYSVEQLDRGQTLLSILIDRKKREENSLNRYIEIVNECEKMLKLNEEERENLSEGAYLRNKETYESDMHRFKKFIASTLVDIENVEREIEETRKKYCL